MKQADKDAVMQNFKDNKLKVLVATSVIEVGVDVPNAVVMVIEMPSSSVCHSSISSEAE